MFLTSLCSRNVPGYTLGAGNASVNGCRHRCRRWIHLLPVGNWQMTSKSLIFNFKFTFGRVQCDLRPIKTGLFFCTEHFTNWALFCSNHRNNTMVNYKNNSKRPMRHKNGVKSETIELLEYYAKATFQKIAGKLFSSFTFY